MQTRLEPPARGPRGARLGALLACTGALTVLGGCGEKRETISLPVTPTRLEVALDSPASAPLAPLYAAIAAGDFTRGGLTVSVTNRPSMALASLAAGGADIAITSEPDLLRARDQGAALVAIGAVVRSPLSAIISIAPHPVTKVTQLAGALLAAPPTPLDGAEVDTILRRGGVASSTVRRRDIGTDPAGGLRARSTTAVLGPTDTLGVTLALAHLKPSLIKIEDAGVPSYNGLVLVVRQAEARNRGPILRSFLQALTIGVTATLATPATAADQLTAANPGLARRFALASLKATLPALDPTSTGSPYGFVDPRVWRAFGAWMLSHGLLTRPDDTARAVTDEFLPGQGE